VVFFNENTGRLFRRRVASESIKAIAWRELPEHDHQIARFFTRAWRILQYFGAAVIAVSM